MGNKQEMKIFNFKTLQHEYYYIQLNKMRNTNLRDEYSLKVNISSSVTNAVEVNVFIY